MPSVLPSFHRRRGAGIVLIVAILAAGCSVRKTAVRSLARSLTEGPSVFATDGDPELVGDAVPFALKTLEILLAEDPGNWDLLLGLCSGYVQYAFAWVELEAERLEQTDYLAAERERERAHDLYLRARGHCLDGLEDRAPGLPEGLRRGRTDGLASLGVDDVPWLYWTGASWGSAIGTALDRPEVLADLPTVIELFERGLALDEEWDRGALHEVMISLSVVPPVSAAGRERAARHYRRALELNGGLRASTPVTYAMAVAVPIQDRDLFRQLMEQALAVDPDAVPADRLINTLYRRRARRLLDRIDELFL